MTFPNHIQSFIENREEVKRLVNIHIKVAGTTRGRKNEVQVLHKSAVVLLVACWESYIESVVSDAFDFMLENSPSHEVFPTSVLVKSIKELRVDKDERKIWTIADQGWRDVLIKYKDQNLKKEIDYFHVPRPANIDDLFERIIGLEKLSRNWTWRGQTNIETITTLNSLIDLRGSIAHKIKVDEAIQKQDVIYYLNFINNLTVSTNNTVSKYVEKRIGIKPWDKLTYKVQRKF
jgi:hypothetical protein